MTEKWKKAAIGLVTGFANGLFGSGGGTIVVPAMERFLKVEEHKAHATAIAVILPLSLLRWGFISGKRVWARSGRLRFGRLPAGWSAASSAQSCSAASAVSGCIASSARLCWRRL